jgi:hypothetical protein
LTYFFHTTGNKKPTNEQVRLLEQFFYWVGVTTRYSSGTESKLGEDFNKMDSIAKGNMPSYQSTELTIDPKTIEETGFSTGNAYCKAILCLLAYQQPKSFDTNGIVILDNSHLKIATSRNYHHFFPTAYLATAGHFQKHRPADSSCLAQSVGAGQLGQDVSAQFGQKVGRVVSGVHGRMTGIVEISGQNVQKTSRSPRSQRTEPAHGSWRRATAAPDASS